MKKTILLLIIFGCGNMPLAQNKLTEIEKLAATSKVWGFLKYYHPKVADGKFNWDEQLFEVLPKVKTSTNKEQLSKVLTNWIDDLGEIRKCTKCENETDYEYFDKNFDLAWVENKQIFTSQLSEKLEYIEKNRHQGKKYYVTSKKRTGNIEVKNEVDYSGFDWKEENLRLLTLFRYWNIVEYFYPYKYQTDTNWNDVLIRMIPEFLYAKTETEFQLGILELIVSIDDSHAGLVTEGIIAFFGDYWIPAKYELIDDKAIITGFYDESLAKSDDFKIGDIITKVNDKEVETLFDEKEKYISGSNISRKKYQAFNAIFNGSSDSVRIEFLRGNKIRSKTVKRYLLSDFTFNKVERVTHKILKGNIGYVDMGIITTNDVPEAMEDLKETKAIILDIRNYPKGTYRIIASHISSKRNDFFKVTYPDLNYPGKFIWRNGTQYGEDGDLKYKGKVVLLVNERTQSHAEFTAMCLQTGDDVTTIGSQTSGADGNVSILEMVGGYKTAISGIGIFYPDNTETQRRGVKVDVEIKPTIQGIIEGRDEVLEKAIELVNE